MMSVSMPKGMRMIEKKARYAMPSMISGIIIGIMETFSSSPCVRKRDRAMPTAPAVPIRIDSPQEENARISELLRERRICELRKSFSYHCSEKPAQLLYLEALKE